MKSLMIAAGCLMLVGCTDVSIKRERGVTEGGYTTYKTTFHAEVVDEPVCHGSCKP